VSRTPVREAVQRLADEGLIEVFPQAGTFVARIPAGALPEAIAVRKALEEITARVAAERATPAQIAAVEATLRSQRKWATQGNRHEFHRADEAFHAAVAEAAGYPGIWTLVQQVKVQVDRFRQLTLPQEGRMALAIREHAAVAAAIRGRDATAAAQHMGAHLERLLSDISTVQRLNPDYFVADGPLLEPGGPPR
jgi:DNA-binding GntR family transcriptional regulator